MNCPDFHELLFDYVDDTLAPRVKARADAHLENCASCRAAVERERTLAGSLRATLQRGTAQLSLDPGFHDRVLRAAAPAPARAPWWSGWRSWHALPLQPAGAACALLLLVGLGFAAHRWSARPRAASNASRPDTITWVVRVPLPAEQPAFEIVDTPSRQSARLRGEPANGAAFAFAAIAEARP